MNLFITAATKMANRYKKGHLDASRFPRIDLSYSISIHFFNVEVLQYLSFTTFQPQTLQVEFLQINLKTHIYNVA